MHSDPSIDELRLLLDYDPETGIFRWKVKRGCRRAGEITGCPNAQGHVVIGLNGEIHYAHRLAWALMRGKWPQHGIDHEDKDLANNRWRNLRAATASQSGANAWLRSDNKTGFKGVMYERRREKWRAEIRLPGGSVRFLGYFNDPEFAALAFDRAAIKERGEYARTNFGDRRSARV